MSFLSNREYVHIVIGIIKNSNQEVLVSKRKAEAHLGGMLEFPGGKVEENESPIDALQRELTEELNIDALNCTPLIQVPYRYPDRKILLDVYLVNDYLGDVTANEGQDFLWQPIDSLDEESFPAANFGVLRALKLPNLFFVTSDYSQESNFLKKFENIVNKTFINIIQLRSHSLNDHDYKSVAKKCADLCSNKKIKLILNRDESFINDVDATGIHLTSKKLLSMKSRTLKSSYLVGASCHNLEEIEHANNLKLDYVFIGPVLEKHPYKNSKTLQWEGFSELAKYSQIPTYAIGGLSSSDIETSIQMGGQGIAAIRSVWDSI